MQSETDLYEPIKEFLEREGYEVKSEITGCDVVAFKSNAPTVIVELKITFSLELVLQGIERQKITNDVYLAVWKPDTPIKQKNWSKRQRSIKTLCKKLGLGLFHVSPNSRHPVDVLIDPIPYRPRKNRRRETRLAKEFVARTGDPNTGGATRSKLITAYRQDALRCANAIFGKNSLDLATIRNMTGVSRAASILQNNYYGWFERVSRGVYRLTDDGKAALKHFDDVVAHL